MGWEGVPFPQDMELIFRTGPGPGTSQTVQQKALALLLGISYLEQNVQRVDNEVLD